MQYLRARYYKQHTEKYYEYASGEEGLLVDELKYVLAVMQAGDIPVSEFTTSDCDTYNNQLESTNDKEAYEKCIEIVKSNQQRTKDWKESGGAAAQHLLNLEEDSKLATVLNIVKVGGAIALAIATGGTGLTAGMALFGELGLILGANAAYEFLDSEEGFNGSRFAGSTIKEGLMAFAGYALFGIEYVDDLIPLTDDMAKATTKAGDSGSLYTKHPDGYTLGPDGGLYLPDVDSIVDDMLKSGGNSWYDDAGNLVYPPNNGFKAGTEMVTSIDEGYTFGRYGKPGPNSDFLTQAGASADELALPPGTNPSTYIEYKVVKPIDNVTKGTVAPWGGSSGGGLQFKLDKPIDWYIRNGYLEVIK